jgi:hypothetical protein
MMKESGDDNNENTATIMVTLIMTTVQPQQWPPKHRALKFLSHVRLVVFENNLLHTEVEHLQSRVTMDQLLKNRHHTDDELTQLAPSA